MDIMLPPELVIIEGEQIGARAQLDNNRTVTLSGAADTDMVLRDTKISNERIKITTINNKAYIEVIDGHIEIEGKSIQQRKKLRLHEYAKVKIGDTAFIYTNEPHISIEEILNKLSTGINKTRARYYQKKQNLFRNKILLSLSILFIVAFAFIIAVKTPIGSSVQVGMSTTENLHRLLKENGFDSLNVKKDASGQLLISGFVMTNKERALLEKLVDELNLSVILNLEVGDQLAMEVRELFRVNGIEVIANVIQKGEVKITAKSYSATEFEKIKDIALKEIVNLKSMNIELEESDGEAQTIGTDMTYNDDDKRITMVVGGDPAYIMTADQSKYYVGALLPTGYKIVDIVDQQVVLEKHGKQKTIEF